MPIQIPSATTEAPHAPAYADTQLRMLVERDGERYYTRNIVALGSALGRAGWRQGELKSSREAARFWRDGALILIYLSGAIVVGGRHFWVASDALGQLCPEPIDTQLRLFDEG